MSRFGFPSRSIDISFLLPAYVIPISALAICAYGASRLKWREASRARVEKVRLSPLRTILPKLSDEEKRALPYPPDLFPGARDVETPFGSVRVYEWGPEDGRKVLFVHGISTPCLSLGRLAQELVEKGCRVVLFDLFGRGYSDNPSDLHHDGRLYISQILIALASSPLSWTGTKAFSIVGYSLGGGIAASFTHAFPNLISSLILIAPSGIVRPSHVAWASKFLYWTQSFLPEAAVEWLVQRNIWAGTTGTTPDYSNQKTDTPIATAAELGHDPTLVLFPDHPHVSATAAVQYQVLHHPGFVPAFISSVRHAPIHYQHAQWQVIGQRIALAQALGPSKAVVNRGMGKGKVLLILGKDDPLVRVGEVDIDARHCFGDENLDIIVLGAGHEVVMSHSTEVTAAMMQFWSH